MNSDTFDPPLIVPSLWHNVTGENAWDVGCSFGNTMTEMIARFKTVVGFEPSYVALEYLSTISTIKGVQVFPLAISDHQGKVSLDLEEGTRRVPCRSLDSLTKKLKIPDFIKVDVTGHEVEVLKGAEYLMITCAPDWLIEVYSEDNGQKCQDILNSFGYKCTMIIDPDKREYPHHYWIRASIVRLDR